MKVLYFNYSKRITIAQGIINHRVHIKGTTITVAAIFEALWEKPDITTLLVRYPEIKPTNLQACFSYVISLVESEDLMCNTF